MFEWDETKRRWVLHERAIDFYDVAEAMEKVPHKLTAKSLRHGEERFVTLLLVREKLYAVIWTLRHGVTRIITVRRAREGEERAYRALFG